MAAAVARAAAPARRAATRCAAKGKSGGGFGGARAPAAKPGGSKRGGGKAKPQKASRVPEGYGAACRLDQVPEANAARGFPFFFGDRGYTLLNVDGELHCIEANSTAWGYPTIDVKVLRDRGSAGLAVEVPLDGTVYDLVTGEVLEWCPSDGGDGMGGLLRKGLAVLKKDETPKAIGVYDVKVLDDGVVAVKRERRALPQQ